MFENKEKALKYIIHVKYGKNTEGSGVLIPFEDEDYSYVLTAKHTFGENNDEREDEYCNIKIENIVKKEISLTNPQSIEFEVQEVFILEENPTLDILILKVKNNKYINELSPLDIFEEKFNYCLPYGYPDLVKDGNTNYEPFNCTYKPTISKTELEIRIEDYINVKATKGTDSYLSGISGAGVFVENHTKNKIFLAGIVIKGTPTPIQTLVCLDLEKISKEINIYLKSLKLETITVSGAEWKNKFGFDMSDLDFQEEIEEFNQKSKNKFIKMFKDEDNFVEKFDNQVKSKLKIEEEKFQKISESYLYIGMNFHQLQEHKRATHYLNKAIEYGGNKNKSYLLNAKWNREEEKTLAQKSEQEKEMMLGFINSLYQNIDEYKVELEKNKDESIKRILIGLYQELIEKLKFFDDRSNEILKAYEESIKLYANFNEYDKIQEQIVDLTDMIELGQQFEGIKNQVNGYQQEIEKLNKHIQLLSTHVSDKTLLNKINFQVFNTDKKLDNISTNLLKKIDDRSDGMDEKIDNISIFLKEKSNKYFILFLKEIHQSNKTLVSKIQMIYNQNNRVNDKVEMLLNISIKNMSSQLNRVMKEPKNDENQYILDVEKVIKSCSNVFYEKIKDLYPRDDNSTKNDLFKKAISLAEQRHEEHMVSLKKSLTDKDREISNLSSQLEELTKWLDTINDEYDALKINSNEFEQKSFELKRMNQQLEDSISQSDSNAIDSLKLMKYQNEVENLKKIIERLKGENEQIDDLKKSIVLSNETSKNLIEFQSNCQNELRECLSQIKNQYEVVSQDENLTDIFREHLNHIKDKLTSIDIFITGNLIDKDDFRETSEQLDRLETSLSEIEEYSSKELRPSINKSLRISENLKGINSDYRKNVKAYKKEVLELLTEVQLKIYNKKPEKLLVQHLKEVEDRWSKIDEKDTNINDNLFVIYSKLQQIKDYVPKKKSKFYILNIMHSIAVFGLVSISLIVLLLNLFWE